MMNLNDIAALLGGQLAFDDSLGAVLDAIAGRDDILVMVTSYPTLVSAITKSASPHRRPTRRPPK